MSKAFDLEYEREKRSVYNTQIRPMSVLRMAQEEYADKNVTKVVVLIEMKEDDGTTTLEQLRGGCTRYDEIAMLSIAHHFAMMRIQNENEKAGV